MGHCKWDGSDPAEADADNYRKFVARPDRALAIIVLPVDPSLLYLLGEHEDPGTVWKKLAEQFQNKGIGLINWP